MDELIRYRMMECLNLIEQFRDASEMYEIDAIDYDTYVERQGTYNACLRVIVLLNEGHYVPDDLFAQIIAEETELASQPSKYELLRADVDYALMLGGEL